MNRKGLGMKRMRPGVCLEEPKETLWKLSQDSALNLERLEYEAGVMTLGRNGQ